MIERLHQQIAATGIPIVGVSGSGPNVRIDFAPEATPQQRSQAAQIAAQFDWRPRQPRASAAILADIQALSPAESQKLIVRLLRDRILEQPFWAIEQGVNVAGDEPVS